jgi:hypothetical protein
MPAPTMTALACVPGFPSALLPRPAADLLDSFMTVILAAAQPSRTLPVRLLDRDLPVDEAEIDVLRLAHETGDHIEGDRSSMQTAHEYERLVVVDALGAVGEPFPDVVAEQADRDPVNIPVKTRLKSLAPLISP